MLKKQPVRTLHEGKVYDLLASGEGLVSLNEDREAPLYFALPGEKVSLEEVAYKKNKFYFLKNIEKLSSDRISPLCKHFGECGGCVLQHMSHNLYKDFKKKLITQPFLNQGLDPFCIKDPIIMHQKTRRRANLDIIKKNNEIYLGFHQVKSHRIININQCYTLAPEIFNLLSPLRETFNLILNNYEKAKVFFTYLRDGVDCSVEIQGIKNIEETHQKYLYEFAKNNSLLRLIFRHGKTKQHIYGQKQAYILFDNIPIEIDAYSFLQASEYAEEMLVNFVKSNLRKNSYSIADLFSGRGTFSIPLSKQYKVYAYDLEKSAINALQKASQQYNLNIEPYTRNLFDSPLTHSELNPFDCIIIDPPRAGCLEQIKEISKSQVKHIIYISCNPNSFAFDAKTLVESGYKLNDVLPIDQFLWSPHIELAATFEKNG